MDISLVISLALCVIAEISLIVALIALIAKKPNVERVTGTIALVFSITSCLLYCYARFILSGGNLSDWRVVLVLAVYIVTAAISALSVIDSYRKLKSVSTE